MDKEQFYNAIKRQDLRILEVSSTPYPIFERLVQDSSYADYLFAKVYSERFKQPTYVSMGIPYKLDDSVMNVGFARETAAHFIREMERAEMERAMNG